MHRKWSEQTRSYDHSANAICDNSFVFDLTTWDASFPFSFVFDLTTICIDAMPRPCRSLIFQTVNCDNRVQAFVFA